MRLHSYILLFIMIFTIVGGCKESKSKSEPQQKDVMIQQGKEIVMQAQSELGKQLMKSIQIGGPQYAVSFCSEKALALTDSLSRELNVALKRVSDKNRNPLNLAMGSELDYIKKAKLQLETGDVITPSLIEKPSGMVGYYPILTNELCIQCHGKPNEDIQQLTMETILNTYPEDLANGYGVNELRGIWVVEFNKK